MVIKQIKKESYIPILFFKILLILLSLNICYYYFLHLLLVKIEKSDRCGSGDGHPPKSNLGIAS